MPVPTVRPVPTLRPQPLLAVTDVPRSSEWYQQVLGATGGHGGDAYEQLLVDGVMVMQLHRLEEDNHHEAIGDPALPLGNGVAVWFEADELDLAVHRIHDAGARVITDVQLNPNSGNREIWLRDPDGYLVVLAGR